MKSWKTTVGGILLAIGTPLAAMDGGEAWVKGLGIALMSIGGLLLGVTARDNVVSDQEAGVRPETNDKAADIASRF